MFLIRTSERNFVDGNKIEWVHIRNDGCIALGMSSGSDTEIVIKQEYADLFVNHLQALNKNLPAFGKTYHELKKKID